MRGQGAPRPAGGGRTRAAWPGADRAVARRLSRPASHRRSRLWWDQRMHRAIEAHLGSQQVSRVIYGSIIGLALVVALEAHPPKAGVVAASLLATAGAGGPAGALNRIVGTQTRTRPPTAR